MPKDNMYISKKETTILKIEMASRAIKEENIRRRAHNKKVVKSGSPFIKAKGTELPILKPDFIHVARRTPKRITMGTKGMDTVFKSGKYLCGALSQLCDVLRYAGIIYPWREQEN